MAREAKIVITSENLAGPAIKSVVKDMLDVEGAAKEVGDSINKAFTAIAIFEAGKKIVEFGADCLKTFGEVERTMTQLKTALGGNEESFSRMGSLIEEMAGKTLASKDEVEKLVAELASLGKSDADIERITQASVALSNVTGKDLNASFMLINATYSGQSGKLAKLVPEIGDLTKAQMEAGAAVDLLNAKFGAISDSMAGGISQKISNLGKGFEELKEALGGMLAPVFSPMIEWLTAVALRWADAISSANGYRDAIQRVGTQSGINKKEAEVEVKTYQLKFNLSDIDTQSKLALADYQEQTNDYTKPDPAKLSRILDADPVMKKLKAERDALNTDLEKLRSELIALKALTPGTPLTPPGGAPAKEAPYLFNNWMPEMRRYRQSTPPKFDSANHIGENGSESGDTGGGMPFSPAAISRYHQATVALEEYKGVMMTLYEMAGPFNAKWSDALEGIKSQFKRWGEMASQIGKTIADGIGNALMSVGASLAAGKDGWADIGKIAMQTLAEVLRGIGAQLAGLATIALVSYRYGDAIIAAAGSTAAFVAAGAAGSAASTMGSSSAAASPESPPSPSSSPGASYTGSQAITFNFYNQGNVVGSGGLEELANLLDSILRRNSRYA